MEKDTLRVEVFEDLSDIASNGYELETIRAIDADSTEPFNTIEYVWTQSATQWMAVRNRSSLSISLL